MQLDIIAPDTNLYSGEVSSIILPGTDGELGILNSHAPLITTLKKGIVKIKTSNGSEETFETNGGVVEVLNNKVIVLAE